jgi:hypothetical protein
MRCDGYGKDEKCIKGLGGKPEKKKWKDNINWILIKLCECMV